MRPLGIAGCQSESNALFIARKAHAVNKRPWLTCSINLARVRTAGSVDLPTRNRVGAI